MWKGNDKHQANKQPHPFAVNEKFLVTAMRPLIIVTGYTKQDKICMNTTVTIYIIQRGWQCSVKEWRFSSYVCIERVRWIIYADRWWIIWVQQLDLKQRSLSSKEKTKTKLFVQSLYMSAVSLNLYASKCHYSMKLPTNISFAYR